MNSFDEKMRQGGNAAIEQAARFFMRDDPVHQTLREVTRQLDSLSISYAIADGMALVAHGYDRTTVDVDILVTQDGLRTIHEKLDGLGYTPPFDGSRNLRDTRTGVRIEFLVAGQFPGDRKSKPVAFPDPAQAAATIDGIRYLSRQALVELKLASGMTAPGRLKDLADVQELIRTLHLPSEFGEQLHPFVRAKYAELWQSVQEP